MAYITDANLKAYLKAHLKSGGTLPDYWDVLIPIANTQAYNEIRRRLIGRGYLAADIDNWDEREFFSYSLGMCQLLKHAAAGDTSDTWQQKFCIADQLDTIDILVDGEVVEPVADAGEIGTGVSTVFDADEWPWEGDE